VFFKPLQVSAALMSGVNPAASGAAGRSSSLAHTPTALALGEGGRQNGKFNAHASAEEMAEALGAGRLELWYQPKIGSQTLELRGAEALIRMRNWASFSPQGSCRKWTSNFYRRCCNSSLPRATPARSLDQFADLVSRRSGRLRLSLPSTAGSSRLRRTHSRG